MLGKVTNGQKLCNFLGILKHSFVAFLFLAISWVYTTPKLNFNKLQAAYSSQSMDIFCLSDENYTGAALTVFWGEGGGGE